MSIFRNFNISMIPGKPPLIVHASQYESDFVYTFNLISGKSVLAIPNTAIAVIRGTKRDGNGYSVEAALDAENHKVVVMGDPQLTACAGRNVFELAIINDEKVICTANFFLDVEHAPLDAGTIQSETVLHDLQAIINSAATATQAAEEASASAESAASAAEQAVEEKFEDGVAETIDAWLTDHPEATTTVQDGSLTYKKLVAGTLGFVIPEMFGAKGDGVTDDTNAWQSAINTGLPVKASKRIYKCGQINIVNDTVIDCANAEFVATDNILFNAYGAVESTITGLYDYTANSASYDISNDYTGLGFLQGTNNFEPLRSYYRGGMLCNFENGVLIDKIPVNITSPSLSKITPVVCTIKNVSNVEFLNTHDGKVINCLYGLNCIFENIRLVSEVYSIVYLDKCYNCCVDNIHAELPAYTGTEPQIYPVGLVDTNRCTVKNSYINNPFWHAVSTGGYYVCYGTTIENCELYSSGNYAIGEHSNCLGTSVLNTKCDGISISGDSTIRDCAIVSRNSAGKDCNILLQCISNEKNANYHVENVRFYPDPAITQTIGVMFRGFAQTENNTAYFSKVVLRDLLNENQILGTSDAIAVYTSNMPGFDSIVFGDIRIENVNLRCNVWDGGNSQLDFTNAVISYNNITEKQRNQSSPRITILLPNKGDVRVSNSYITQVSAHATRKSENLYLSNVKTSGTMEFHNSGKVVGSNIHSGGNITLTDTNLVALSNVHTATGSRIYQNIWRMGSTGDCFAKQLTNSAEPVNVILVDV